MNRLKLTIFMLSVLIVAGCSTTANLESLVLSSEDLGQASQFKVGVGVEVIGGMEGLISSDLYKSALTDSIVHTRIFRSIDTSKNPQYKLFVIILRFEVYSFGYSSVMISKWILQKDGEEIWSDTVIGNGGSNTFGGVARMRESAERSGKDNILNGLKLIGAIAPKKIPEQVASTSLLTESSESANLGVQIGESIPDGDLSKSNLELLFSNKIVSGTHERKSFIFRRFYSADGTIDGENEKNGARQGKWRASSKGLCIQWAGKKEKCRVVTRENNVINKYKIKRTGERELVISYSSFETSNMLNTTNNKKRSIS